MIKVYHKLETLPAFKKAVITIGTFDGVHLGHQQIIDLLKKEANNIGGETVIITFHPHPRKIVAGGTNMVNIINTLDEKINLLEKQGVQHVVVVPFTEAFANLSAEEYVEHFLVRNFYPHTIIIGYDHKFGRNRSGDYHLLEDLGKKFQYNVKEIPEKVLNEVTISSTKVREAIRKCNVQTANTLLGYNYFFSGKIIQGNKLGRTIGYPTANIVVEDEEKLLPGNGVYAVTVSIGSNSTMHKGMMNIGVRPTIDGINKVIEVNIFDFDKDIYEETLTIHLHEYLREERKFESLEKLKEQLANDEMNARKTLS